MYRNLSHGLMLASIVVLALAVGSCTRPASTPPPAAATQGVIPGGLTGQQATMEAVRAALLTQTAQAAFAAPPSSTQIPPTSVPTSTLPVTGTPLIVQATGTQLTPTRVVTGVTEYTVQEGDWLYGVANKFGVEPQAIIDLNNLTAPYTLAIGQVLKIPTSSAATAVPPSGTPFVTKVAGGTQYTVQLGDWVYSIARKFGVDPYDIIEANNLTPPYTIYPGQVLTIP